MNAATVRAVAMMVFSLPAMAAAQQPADEPESRARDIGRAYMHVVREGETLASIAQRYYGDPKLESVLVAENGLTAEGGAAIVVGLRLVIPWVSYHRVQEGESWSELAERFYGDAKRAFVLIDANDGSARKQPEVGAELRVPYPLRHVAEQGETIRDVAIQYYGDRGEVRTLRRFNHLRQWRLSQGQIVLVPLEGLVLSDEGRRIIEKSTGQAPPEGKVRKMQKRIDERLPDLEAHLRRGRYAEAVALGNRLLGAGELTGNQIVTIERRLGTAYVALERADLAVESFKEALRRQPDLELDPTRHSPRVMDALQQARAALKREEEENDEVRRDAGNAEPRDDASP